MAGMIFQTRSNRYGHMEFFIYKRGTDDWNYAIKRLEKRRAAPARLISHHFISEQLREGLAVMHSKKEDYCKIMFTGNLAL